tara:strand:+ start:3145 stop:3825 length:681 start_codon:yes stop_codon:yes gene_type:complete
MLNLIKILFLLILFLNFSVKAFPIPENNEANFDIIRKNKVIGSYNIFFSKDDDFNYIETKIYILVKIMFVTAYEFSHNSKEIWKNNKFISIEAHTDFEDEREYFIKGNVEEDFFHASGMDGNLKLNKNLIPSNYWNIDVMYQKEVFDTQKGIARDLDIKELDEEIIEINGKKILCKKFILNASQNPKDKGPFPTYTLWYSENNELMKFKFKNWKDKKIVTIVRNDQ